MEEGVVEEGPDEGGQQEAHVSSEGGRVARQQWQVPGPVRGAQAGRPTVDLMGGYAHACEHEGGGADVDGVTRVDLYLPLLLMKKHWAGQNSVCWLCWPCGS